MQYRYDIHRVCIYIYVEYLLDVFFWLLLLFLVEDHKFRKDTLLVSYFSALMSCFSTSSASAMFGSRPFKKTSTGGLGIWWHVLHMKFIEILADVWIWQHNFLASRTTCHCSADVVGPKLLPNLYHPHHYVYSLLSWPLVQWNMMEPDHLEGTTQKQFRPKNNLGDLVEFCVSIVGSAYQVRT